MPFDPIPRIIRSHLDDVALAFVHGYSGDVAATWGEFPSHLAAEPHLRGWDILSFGYPTNLFPDLRYLWSAKPSISRLAELLRTQLMDGSLNPYRRVAILAPSLGGLVGQRAILDDRQIVSPTSHLILFGDAAAAGP